MYYKYSTIIFSFFKKYKQNHRLLKNPLSYHTTIVGPITATFLQRLLSCVPKMVVVEKFDYNRVSNLRHTFLYHDSLLRQYNFDTKKTRENTRLFVDNTVWTKTENSKSHLCRVRFSVTTTLVKLFQNHFTQGKF